MMKRIIICFMACLLTMGSSAQSKVHKIVKRSNRTAASAKVQPMADVKHVNFIYKDDFMTPVLVADSTGTDYYVFRCPGETAEQLYRKAMVAVGKVYRNPSRVMSGVEGSSLTINAAKESIYSFTAAKSLVRILVKYSFCIEFRDGRIKVNAPAMLQAVDADDYTDETVSMRMSNTEKGNEYARVLLSLNDDVNMVLAAMDNDLKGDDW